MIIINWQRTYLLPELLDTQNSQINVSMESSCRCNIICIVLAHDLGNISCIISQVSYIAHFGISMGCAPAAILYAAVLLGYSCLVDSQILWIEQDSIKNLLFSNFFIYISTYLLPSALAIYLLHTFPGLPWQASSVVCLLWRVDIGSGPENIGNGKNKERITRHRWTW